MNGCPSIVSKEHLPSPVFYRLLPLLEAIMYSLPSWLAWSKGRVQERDLDDVVSAGTREPIACTSRRSMREVGRPAGESKGLIGRLGEM